MTVYTEAQSIYVASLKDYNAGNLHGVRIELNECDDLDEVWAKINAMLAASPEAKDFPQGGPAEEWAIHDFEGFGTWRISEYESIQHVFVAAKFIENAHNKTAAAIFLGEKADDLLDDDATPESLDDAFSEHFAGEWDTQREFVEDLVSELGLPNVGNPKVQVGRDEYESLVDAISPYLDWDVLVRDMTEGFTLVSEGGRVFAFRDEA